MVRRIFWLFAIAGCVPFAAATVALLWGDSHIRVPAIAALVTYSAIVISFLGGIEGGLSLSEQFANEKARAHALVLSTIPSLAAWGVLWLPSTQWQLGASIGLFIAVWAADLWLARSGLIPSWFVDLRTAATAIVCVILGLALYLL
jgi:hypothetical protein